MVLKRELTIKFLKSKKAFYIRFILYSCMILYLIILDHRLDIIIYRLNYNMLKNIKNTFSKYFRIYDTK